MVEELSSVWNGLSVMELANVLFLHRPLPGLSRAGTARYVAELAITSLASLSGQEMTSSNFGPSKLR